MYSLNTSNIIFNNDIILYNTECTIIIISSILVHKYIDQLGVQVL